MANIDFTKLALIIPPQLAIKNTNNNPLIIPPPNTEDLESLKGGIAGIASRTFQGGMSEIDAGVELVRNLMGRPFEKEPVTVKPPTIPSERMVSPEYSREVPFKSQFDVTPAMEPGNVVSNPGGGSFKETADKIFLKMQERPLTTLSLIVPPLKLVSGKLIPAISKTEGFAKLSGSIESGSNLTRGVSETFMTEGKIPLLQKLKSESGELLPTSGEGESIGGKVFESKMIKVGDQYRVRVGSSMRKSLIDLRGEIANAEAGKRIFLDIPEGAGGSQRVVGASSSFPIKGLGSKKKQLKIIDKVLNYEPLTPNQGFIYSRMDEYLKNKRKMIAEGIHKDKGVYEPGKADFDFGENLNQPLTPYDTPEIIAARKEARSIPETYKINTPERIALREKIANDYYGVGSKVKNKTLDLVLGGPAVGKTKIARKIMDESGSIIIDNDAIKEFLPEYRKGIGASAVHKESSNIIESAVLDRAIINGDNIVLPRIGKNVNTIKSLIDLFKQNGYAVKLHFVDLPLDEAAKRVITRFKETGRFVDPDYLINEVGLKPIKTYDTLKMEGVIDEYTKYTNQVPKGTGPVQIERGGKRGVFGPEYHQNVKKLPQEETRASTEVSPSFLQPQGKPTNAEQKIIQALKEAKPIRSKQEAIYSAERAQRIARVVAMGKKVPGQKGYYAQLGQLKGQMPKVQFEGIRAKNVPQVGDIISTKKGILGSGQYKIIGVSGDEIKVRLINEKGNLGKNYYQLYNSDIGKIESKVGLDQKDIDEIFKKIEDHEKLLPFEKITAKTGLEKLVGEKGGSVPTRGELSLLSEVFSSEFIDAILEKRPLMNKIWSGVGQVLNLPRAMMATADLSAPLRQGIFLVGRPKQWIPAFKDMFKYAFSEKAYEGLAKDIQSRPTYPLMREGNLSFTDLGKNLHRREELFMSNWSEKIPVFGPVARGSNRAYSGFLNKLRADSFDDLIRKAEDLGLLKGNQKSVVVKDIAKFVNSATGRGELGNLDKAAVALNGLFFSPRLMASRLNLLNPIYYAKLHPFIRKEALKSLFSFAGAAGTIFGLAKLGGAQIGTDPRNADFAKIKIGKTRFDILGGFQQYVVLASRLITGQMVSSTTGKEFNLGEGYKPTTRADIIQRFFESKSSPVASFALGLLRGKTSGGYDFDLPVEVVNRFIPMLAQDMYDLYKENGLKGLAMGIPGVFGVGSQTYSDQIPLESRTKLGKPTIKWEQTPGLAEDFVNKIRGGKVAPVPVKAVYDKAQALIKEGKEEEAQNLVNELSDKDYELYKKFKQKDARIRKDEMTVKIEPIYKKIKELKRQGNVNEAQKIVDEMTDEEYKIYKRIKASDYKMIE